jgi:hypothetical protein
LQCKNLTLFFFFFFFFSFRSPGDVANEIDRRTYSSTITTTLTPTAIAYNDAKLAFYSAKERHDNAETRLTATPPTDPLYLHREDAVNSAGAAMEAARVAMEAARVADETARARWLAAARAEEAAAAARAPPTLTMEGVNAWLERNPLAVDGILAPPNTPLWWRLSGSADDELLNPSAQEWLNSTANVAAIIGVSGCGKTRTMYELLSTHFGFYWTCARQGNGGSELLQRALKSRVLDTSDRSVVEREVQVMAVKYCILFLQWRQAHPTGTPFQWHVFQTTFKAIDEALKSVELFVEGHEVASQAKAAKAMIERVDRSLPVPLVLIVDEAQILASRGEFESLSAGVDALRSLLQPFVSAAADTFSFCLVTGTSLALQNAQELEGRNWKAVSWVGSHTLNFCSSKWARCTASASRLPSTFVESSAGRSMTTSLRSCTFDFAAALGRFLCLQSAFAMPFATPTCSMSRR